MAIYRVLLDGYDIYDPSSKGLALINPVVKTEAGAAGNFEFTMPPGHVFYDKVTPYGSNIEVLEDGQSIFFGRPLKPKIGFYNQKTYHCEGALAFLNDSRPMNAFVYENIDPKEYFRTLIGMHNALQTTLPSRRFTVGNLNISVDWDVYREADPSMTIMEHIKKGCIGTDGGYLFTRRVNGTTYIDWVASMPYTCNQTVEFGINLLDMSRDGNDDIYTGVMLKGGESTIRRSGRTSHQTVKYGPMWIDSPVRQKYGDILAYQEYGDILAVQDLIAAGEVFLMSQQFDSLQFDITAAEQHYLNTSLDIFKAGQMVHMVSNPHFVDMMIPCQSVEVRLDSAEKKVTLGNLKRQTLTKIQRKIQEEQEDNTLELENIANAIDTMSANVDDMQSDVDDLIDNQGIVTGDDGFQYAVGVDSDGNVYAVKIPLNIEIAEYKSKYQSGAVYDGTSNIVNAIYKENEEPENITSECEFNIRHSGDTIEEWPADGYSFSTWLTGLSLVAYYAVKERVYEAYAPIEVVEISAIHIAVKPSKLTYTFGETLDYTGIHVYLIDNDGEVYKDEQYPTGEIPFEELIFPAAVAEPDAVTVPEDNPYGVDSFNFCSGGVSGTRYTGAHLSIVGHGDVLFIGDHSERTNIQVVSKTQVTTSNFSTSGDTSTTFNKIANSSSYTFDGKKIYFASIVNENSTGTSFTSISPEVGLYGKDITVNMAAWIAMYGGYKKDGDAEIPVQWRRNDGVVLEDTFEIEISGE